MIESFDSRTALLPLHYESRRLSVNDEFIVDYKYGRFFINKEGIIEEICRDDLVDMVNESIDEVLNINVSTVDFNKLISNINTISDWVSSHTGTPRGSRISTFDQLGFFLSGMNHFNFTIKDMLDNKVNWVQGKELSDNDLSDRDVEKIESIEYGAETYVHPDEYQCDINRGVYKLNGYPEPGIIGNIELSPYDIGLGNIDRNANYYEHPETKECDSFMIESLNGMTGDVQFDKSTVDLPDMVNMPLSSPRDYMSDNSYATPAIIENYLSSIEGGKNIKATDSYISDKITVVIKKTEDGQINEISYIDGGTTIRTSIDVFIEDLYALDGGDRIMILSHNKLLMYKYTDGEYIESNIFDNVDNFDYTTIASNIVKRIIEPRNGIYGVILTDRNKKDFIYTWGRLNIETPVYGNQIEKVEIVDDVIYILFDNGKVEYKEYLDGMVDNRYREVILTYNDIIDIFVREDFFVCIRGNRNIVVVGDDSDYNHGVPSELKANMLTPYKIYIHDDIACILSVDNKVRFMGRRIDKLESIKLQYTIEKVTIYKNKVIFIDEMDNMISIL